MKAYQARVEAALERWLPAADAPPEQLHRAMRYAVLDGGKRVRPFLVYATGQALGAPPEALDGPACAVELIHTYSLVHDDLPAMDNDALRRGRPTCHIAFGEATALLAGDALQTLAFQVLARDPAITADTAGRVDLLGVLAEASGAGGMAGGQAVDLESVGRTITPAQLEQMHRLKTGALIRASVALGARAAGCTDAGVLEALDHYAAAVGLAFQVQDDILDVTGDTATLGKTQGADAALNKPTYPALLGLEQAQRLATALHDEAIEALSGLDGRADLLRQLARYIVGRSH